MTSAINGPTPVNGKALGWTIGVHVLLFLLFFLLKYSVEVQKPIEDYGMEVNLGTSDNGSGNDQPMAVGDPANAGASSHYTQSSQSQSGGNQDVAGDVDVNNQASSSPLHHAAAMVSHSTNPQTNPSITPQQQTPKYTYTGATGPGGNRAQANHTGTSEGITHGPGDQGVPGGTPGAPNYTGTPGPGGMGFSSTFHDRSVVADPMREAVFREGGKVVVRVKVDRQGNATVMNVKSSTSAELRKIALEKVKKIKYNPAPNAPIEQFGEVTITFKPRS